MPELAKKAVYQYMVINSEGMAKVTDNKYKLSSMSMDKLKKLLEPEYGNFDEYHANYMMGFSKLEKKVYKLLYPIILSLHGDVIEDGWHRFHMYVEQGLKIVPVIELLPKRKSV